MNEILKVKNISKRFGKKKVLENLDFALEKGKVYGLLGKNGEGKTTLTRIIMGVIPADRGSLYYKNEKINFRDSRYKKELGFIPEESIYFGRMSLREMIDFNGAFYPTWDSKKAESYLERFSLDRRTKVKNLSRGMKLKLGLIIALASKPEVLILDDPTSGLDVLTRNDFCREIIRELSEAGSTILFCSHMVHEIEGIIDHLGILNSGRLILNEDFQKVKALTKRITLRFAEPPKDEIKIDGTLTKKRDRNEYECVVYPWTEEKKKKVENLKPAKMKEGSLNLEEIFISFVSRPEEKTERG